MDSALRAIVNTKTNIIIIEITAIGIPIAKRAPTKGNQKGAVIAKKTIAASSIMKAVSPGRPGSK